MKKIFMVLAVVAGVVGALSVFFAMQATPKNVLNLVRAEALEIRDGVITVPATYTVIKEEAFAGKVDFNKVVIQGEAIIEKNAFYGCPNLRSVILEKSCSIGEGAFGSCPVLESVSVNSPASFCADDAFDGHGGVTLYCREGCAAMETAQKRDISYQVAE